MLKPASALPQKPPDNSTFPSKILVRMIVPSLDALIAAPK